VLDKRWNIGRKKIQYELQGKSIGRNAFGMPRGKKDEKGGGGLPKRRGWDLKEKSETNGRRQLQGRRRERVVERVGL